MLIRVDPARPDSLQDQVAAAVRRGIAEGQVTAGDRLPPARELAQSLDVSIHTVLAGYQKLRDEGLIELRRGRGAVVRAGAHAGRTGVAELVRGLVVEARRHGIGDDELVELVRTAL
ncbi:GntR family transcriptional regulator [Pseudonocardia xishanensis]|uniref:GntR family transcriptional regulator n=1 Tax=Pseudonocardia xishanensis TaxID=630995 RepID=A0ABP8RPX9_9PSEU